MAELRRVFNKAFGGMNINRPHEKLPPEEFQLDLNGDRRRRGAWRARPGYARFLSGELVPTFVGTVDDDFDRADAANLGANWTNYGCTASPPKIVSNKCEDGGVTGVFMAAGYNAFAWGADQAVRAKVTVGDSSEALPLVCVRMSAAGAYAVGINGPNNTLRLYRIDNWGTCSLGSGSVTILAEYSTILSGGAPILHTGDYLRLHVNGSLLLGLVNSRLLLQAIDATIATGLGGLAWSGGSIATPAWALDDWEGGGSTMDLDNVNVAGVPEHLVAFERGDEEVRLVTVYDETVAQFGTGVPEGG